MGNMVYITYENSPRGPVTGVYANKKLAEKERAERHDLDLIDSYELKGCKEDLFDLSINEECCHYIKRIDTIRILIRSLYDIEGCTCGGLAHVVVDDDNFDDDTIDFVLLECDKEENKNREEVGLVKLICNELKKLTMQQRALLFTSYMSFNCDKDCKECPINNGKIERED